MYRHMCIYIYRHMYIPIHISIYIYMHNYMCMYIHIYTYTHTQFNVEHNMCVTSTVVRFNNPVSRLLYYTTTNNNHNISNI